MVSESKFNCGIDCVSAILRTDTRHGGGSDAFSNHVDNRHGIGLVASPTGMTLAIVLILLSLAIVLTLAVKLVSLSLAAVLMCAVQLVLSSLTRIKQAYTTLGGVRRNRNPNSTDAVQLSDCRLQQLR